MTTTRPFRLAASLLILAALAAGCGDSDDDAPAGNDTGGQDAGQSPVTDPTAPSTFLSADQAFIDEALLRINTARRSQQQCGDTSVPPVNELIWHQQLEQSALGHSQWMQQNNSFGHDGENGNDTGDRLTATGYEWRIVSENVAGGYPDLQAVMADWLASPSHCLTLMNGSAIHMAVRVVDGTSANEYSNYWTLVVAAPR